jgi:hypothetical protein
MAKVFLQYLILAKTVNLSMCVLHELYLGNIIYTILTKKHGISEYIFPGQIRELKKNTIPSFVVIVWIIGFHCMTFHFYFH